MKLPEPLEIERGKVRDYLLSRTHPVGRFKARVFAALGFDVGLEAEFVAEVLRLARAGDVEENEQTPFGAKYTVSGELIGPLGSRAVSTVWFRASGGGAVRLVTVRPR